MMKNMLTQLQQKSQGQSSFPIHWCLGCKNITIEAPMKRLIFKWKFKQILYLLLWNYETKYYDKYKNEIENYHMDRALMAILASLKLPVKRIKIVLYHISRLQANAWNHMFRLIIELFNNHIKCLSVFHLQNIKLMELISMRPTINNKIIVLLKIIYNLW